MSDQEPEVTDDDQESPYDAWRSSLESLGLWGRSEEEADAAAEAFDPYNFGDEYEGED